MRQAPNRIMATDPTSRISPRTLGVAGSGRFRSSDLRFITIARPQAWESGAPSVARDGRVYRALKRMVDIVVVLLALPVALPIIALCALAVRLDSEGAAFFTQLRTGRGGRKFRMYKLRTMVHDAAELKQKYAHLNELSWPDFKITNDPRVTRIGGFLRRTSLDELPQLLNVLRGDMSLVGPRPTSFGADTYRLWHTARLEVQPGLTGLWQVSGRNELDFDDRLRLDISYIRNRSLMLDFLILLKTFSAVFSGRGAS
ncbi:MAG TPA: sugar transferase [Longimicrobiales bacterium]|nr:sugar transferase [Longimicrobiales bacterium]